VAARESAKIALMQRARGVQAPTPSRHTAQAADDISPEEYMPRLWYTSTQLIADDGVPYGDPGPRGEMDKMNMATIEWDDESNLNWFNAAPSGTRGFEVEIYPDSEDAEWSDYWRGEDEGDDWASNLPDPYLDDLSSDIGIKHLQLAPLLLLSYRR
jgi:hypothetical protein